MKNQDQYIFKPFHTNQFFMLIYYLDLHSNHLLLNANRTCYFIISRIEIKKSTLIDKCKLLNVESIYFSSSFWVINLQQDLISDFIDLLLSVIEFYPLKTSLPQLIVNIYSKSLVHHQ